MIVKNYSLPDADKLALVRDYVDGKKWGDFLYFEESRRHILSTSRTSGS